MDEKWLKAIVALPIIALVWLLIRRIRERVEKGDDKGDDKGDERSRE